MNQPDDPGVNPFDWRDSEPMSWTKGLIYGAIVATIIALFSIAFTREARAHEWFSHQKNPVTHMPCCFGGPAGDCQVIEEDQWWTKDGKIFVRWFDGNVYSIPANQALPSQDKKGKAAACILNGRFYCFFLPLAG